MPLEVVDGNVGGVCGLCTERLIGGCLVDHQGLMAGIFLLAKREECVAMTSDDRHLKGADKHVVQALAAGHQGAAVPARRRYK